MDATQQHLLDLYRAAQLRQPAPPAPAEGQWQAVREFRTWRDFQAVVAGHSPRAGSRHSVLARLLGLRSRRTAAALPSTGTPATAPARPATAPARAPQPACSTPGAPRA